MHARGCRRVASGPASTTHVSRDSDQSSRHRHGTSSSEPGSHRTPVCSPAATTQAPASRARATAASSAGWCSGFAVPRLRLMRCGWRVSRPVDGADQRRNGRVESVLEHSRHPDLGARRLLADHGRDGRPMAQPIDEVHAHLALGTDAHAAGHAAHVGMGRVDAAVDDDDAHALSGARSKTVQVQRPSHKQHRG